MQHILFILQQNIHLLFLQYLFVCVCNFYFFSKIKNKKFVALSVIFSCIMSVQYLWLNFYTTIFAWLFLMLLNQKILKVPSYNNFLYPTLAVFLLIFSDYVMELFFQTIFEAGTIRIIINLVLSAFLAILMKKFLARISNAPNFEIFKRILCAFLLFTVGIYYVLISMNRFLEESSIDFRVHAFLLLFYSCLSIILCMIALFIIRKRTDLQIKKIEMEQILLYTQQLEENHKEIRKFKHDYKNILTSIEILIQENNMEKLAQYYEKYIGPTKQEIETNFSYLSDLSLVKVPEIKSIFFSKLAHAQSLGIETKFECHKEVTEFYVDSLVLVRSLGILLDNAIEEVAANNNIGKIIVACIQQGNSIQIIIYNTCRENLPQVHQMKQEGFSTKSENRGLGLSNLENLLSSLKNVTLDTQCSNGTFIQIIEISKEEKYATHSYL